MRCAHCRHEAPYRAWYQYRLNGGYRCAACRNVYYIEDWVVQSRTVVPLCLMFAMYIAGLFVLLSNDLLTRPLLLLYLLALAPIAVSVFYMALNDAPTVTAVPERVVRRRQWAARGVIAFLVTNVLTLLIGPGEVDPAIVQTLRIAGGIALVACLTRGHAEGPDRALSTGPN